MHNSRDIALGGWQSDSNLAETVRTSRSEGLESGVPDGTRFLVSVAKALRHQLSFQGQEPQAIAVFFLGEPPQDFPETQRFRVLGNGQARLLGNIWFANQAMSAGSGRSHHDVDVEVLLAGLVGYSDLALRPAVLYDPAEPDVVRWFAKGVDHGDGSLSVPIADTPIALKDIFAVIDQIHVNCLITPEAQDKQLVPLWSKTDKKKPVKLAEKAVQHYLYIGLVAGFPTCDIRIEQSMPVGRTDIEIERQSALADRVDRFAILELKVLRLRPPAAARRSMRAIAVRSSTSAADTVIKWGVRQTARYGNVRRPTQMALCCFDMRIPPEVAHCFHNAQAEADTLGVSLKAWPLYHSSRALDSAS